MLSLGKPAGRWKRSPSKSRPARCRPEKALAVAGQAITAFCDAHRVRYTRAPRRPLAAAAPGRSEPPAPSHHGIPPDHGGYAAAHPARRARHTDRQCAHRRELGIGRRRPARVLPRHHHAVCRPLAKLPASSGKEFPVCGIVGAAAGATSVGTLVDNLKRWNTAAYGSAGVISAHRRRRPAGASTPEPRDAATWDPVAAHPLSGHTEHPPTRWATHGAPSQRATPSLARHRGRGATTASSRTTTDCAPELRALGCDFATDRHRVVAHLDRALPPRRRPAGRLH